MKSNTRTRHRRDAQKNESDEWGVIDKRGQKPRALPADSKISSTESRGRSSRRWPAIAQPIVRYGRTFGGLPSWGLAGWRIGQMIQHIPSWRSQCQRCIAAMLEADFMAGLSIALHGHINLLHARAGAHHDLNGFAIRSCCKYLQCAAQSKPHSRAHAKQKAPAKECR